MRERPIIFSAPMVRAILAGAKTQTRRVVRQQITPLADGSSWHQFDHRGSNYRMNLRNGTVSQWSPLLQFCPYGQPGDRLWVRETHAPQSDCWGSWERWTRGEGGPGPVIHYKASDERAWVDRWRPSIHMPRWASRITLEITSVRVERLQDISEADAIAEGCIQNPNGYYQGGPHKVIGLKQMATAVRAYRDLWESINGPSSWDANPWVWVVEFKRVEGEA